MSHALARLIVVALIAVFAESAWCADPVTNTAPDYKSMADVGRELHFIRNTWYGDGMVIVGRLTLPENARVSARMPIDEDGSYCTALYRGRRLVFYAHGYDPLEITRCSPIAANVGDAGTRQFVKAKPQDTRTLHGTATTAGTGGNATKINCTLQIRNLAYLWGDEGYRGGAPVTVSVDTVALDTGMPFDFNNLSRLPYVLVLTAPGHIKQEIEIDQKLNGVIDLGKIALAPALSYRITYKARVRQNGGQWIGENEARASTIVCDGDRKFLFTKQRDGLGNDLELQMQPGDKGVAASFFYYQPNSFYDLGQLATDKLPSWEDVSTSNLKGDVETILQDGHAYYFTIDEINGTGIQMVFQVKSE